MKVFGVIGLIVGLMFLGPLLGVTVGAFSGWVAGLVFTETLTHTAGLIGFDQSWELGAALGFVGGFFKAANSSSSK